MVELLRIVELYCAVWNETGEAARLALLEQVWADGGSYVDPQTHVSGRAELAAHIGRVQAARPGMQIVLRTAVDMHHGFLRFGWHARGAQGEVLIEGVDFGELAAMDGSRRSWASSVPSTREERLPDSGGT